MDLLKELIWRKFLNVIAVHSAWKSEKITVVTQDKIRQINSLVFSVVKMLLSRNFCQRSVTVNFCNFHTWKNEKIRQINS